MALTSQQAKTAVQDLINSNSITEEGLRTIINDLSIQASGNKTVLYSSAGSLTSGMAENPNIRILDKTEASKFLNGLYDAFEKLYPNEEPDFSINS